MKRCLLYGLAACILTGCNGEGTQAVTEPLYQEQWALHYDKPFYDAYGIDPEAHIHGETSMAAYRGRGIRVAVIDVGIDKDHPDIKENLSKTVNSRDRSGNVGCDLPSDCYHGTAVTGVIASGVNGVGLRGIAPKSEIIFIKLDLNGYVSDNEILDALEIAEEENADVINCSWGTEEVSPVVKEKIESMSKEGRNGRGTVFVFASGNSGKELLNDESMLDSVIGVGASDEENLRAVYSNFGSGLDLMAPGGYKLGITTAYESNDTFHEEDYLQAEDYEKFQGTSASAPIVAASVALLLEANPLLTRSQVRQILVESSDKIGHVPYAEGRNDYYGHGKINLDRAVTMAL